MAKLIEQPEQFKIELKDKWLDYYQANRSWLKPLMNPNGHWYCSIQYQEGELEELKNSQYQPCRPPSLFILGVVTTLEPEIQGLCNFVPPTIPDKLIPYLGLDFDPEIELKKREQQESQRQDKTPSEYLDEIREEIKT